ncbi:sensor histidine kinase [Nocardia sp. NPDC004068]|uniref:sensor histidine kinase n=1 Tax=Nocardia sp. NPDC004068 TaxID=3364303 RepID=UPI00367B45D8
MAWFWPAWHPRRWGLRVRSALIVAVVVAVSVAVATVSLTYLLYRSLVAASDEAATTRINQITEQLAHDTPAELDRTVLETDSRITAVQILDAAGSVVQASGRDTRRPLTTARPPTGMVAHELPRTDEAESRVSGTTVDAAGGRYTVLVAMSEEESENTVKLVGVLVAIAGPLIVIVAAATAYVMVGWSLRSVERIRTRVAAISGADLVERVPVPEPRDEIAALARTMNDMLARVKAGQDAQRRFVADASHELRSPLTTITTGLELGLTRPEMLDTALVRDTLLPEAARMQHLIEDLLLLARADEHGLPIRRTEVDLDDLLATETARTRADSGLRVSCTTRPVRIVADPRQIARVIRNVLDNAARYADTHIDVVLTADDHAAHLAISDDGPGIPTPARERVFDRFYRVQTDRARDTGGFGLGLAIVAEIVTAHHGRVRIDEASPHGTRVTIDLPRADPEL